MFSYFWTRNEFNFFWFWRNLWTINAKGSIVFWKYQVHCWLFCIYNACKSTCHRIGYLSWKGSTSNHSVQLSDHFRAYQKLKRIIKGVVQMPLKYFMLSRKPVPVFYQCLSEEMFSSVQCEHPLAQLRTILMCPITKHRGEELNTSIFNFLPQEAES